MSADISLPEPSGAKPNSSASPSHAPSASAENDFPLRPPVHRQRPANLEQAAPHDQQISVLTSLLANLIEKKSGAPTVPAQRAAKIHRFEAKGMAAQGGDPSIETESEAPAQAVPGFPPDSPESARPGADTTQLGGHPIRWRTESMSFRRRRNWALAYWAIVLLVAIAAFAAGRRTSDISFTEELPVVPDKSQVAREIPWSEGNLAQLDHIFEADQAGDLETAIRVGTGLRMQAGPLPGLEAYIDQLMTRRGQVNDAQAALLRLSSGAVEGGEMAAIEKAMGFTLVRQRRFQRASASFGRAALADPFSAENFRLWGESLRRQGKLREAVAALREALERYPVGPVEFMEERDYVEYKIRLTQIEGGLDPDLETTLRAGVANKPDGYWLLTEAAFALQQGDIVQAVPALRNAAAAFPAPVFARLLNDYFFRAYSGKAEVAGFFPAHSDAADAELKARQVYFLDP